MIRRTGDTRFTQVCTTLTSCVSSLATDIFHVAEHDVHVIAGDIGGSFGLRGGTYPEQVLVMWVPKRLGVLSSGQPSAPKDISRTTRVATINSVGKLAIDRDGNFLGLHVKTLAALGAYITTSGNGHPSTISELWQEPTDTGYPR